MATTGFPNANPRNGLCCATKGLYGAFNAAKTAAAYGLGEADLIDKKEVQQNRCTCHACWPISPLLDPPSSFMRLCPLCGNKRCPKASDHRLDCSGSNIPDQPGSIYGEKMKTKFREPPKYDLQGSIEVFMNDRRYYAWLDTELVVGQVFGRNGKAFLRRVSSCKRPANPC